MSYRPLRESTSTKGFIKHISHAFKLLLSDNMVFITTNIRPGSNSSLPPPMFHVYQTCIECYSAVFTATLRFLKGFLKGSRLPVLITLAHRSPGIQNVRWIEAVMESVSNINVGGIPVRTSLSVNNVLIREACPTLGRQAAVSSS